MKPKTAILIGLALALAPALASAAGHATARYTLPGTLVANDSQHGLGAPVDDGAVVCSASTGDGFGGTCLAWASVGDADAVLVVDDASGRETAFQVCIDNDGDGVCGGSASSADGTVPACQDEFFFSHDDRGRFFNPLGPLPTSFRAGCERNGGFPGWIVYACQGAHVPRGGSGHSHAATTGTTTAVVGGTGYGDFCGGGDAFDRERNSRPNENAKEYEITA